MERAEVPPAGSVPLVRLQVSHECGEQVRAALGQRCANRPVTMADVSTAPADAIVLGGRDVDADLATALDAGVRWVQTLTSGVDRVVGPRFAGRDIVVTN